MTQDSPASPMSAGKLEEALRSLGQWGQARDRMIALLRDHEGEARQTGVDVRETVSGPILDALFGHGQPVSKTLASGLTISARYTSKIIRDFIMSGENPDHVWEPQTTRALLELTRSAKNVVIGGAYIGDHAILIADQIRSSGKVHCFELSADNVAVLRDNIAQNHLDNVEVNQIGLWSTADAKVELVGDDSHATPRQTDAGNDNAFPVTTIDDYADASGIPALDLIMLDIEGGELEALKGAEAFLTRPAGQAPIVLFEIHGSYSDWSHGLDQTDVVRHLIDRGYTVFALRDYHSNVPMNGSPVELVELDDVFIGGPKHGFNMLATKTPDALDPDVFRRVRGVSPKLLFHRDPKLHAPLHGPASHQT